jgi:phosphatidylserine/phosphatidylglycerophosphate/cardiolipin synthase-like enzyme
MQTQNQWLFEVPFAFEVTHYPDSYFNSDPFAEGNWEQSSRFSSRQPIVRETVSGFPRYSNLVRLLPAKEQQKINQIARLIVNSYSSGQQPIRTVQLIGHADKDTPRRPDFEKKISGDRALEVQKALINAINNPVISSQISWERISLGATQLLVATPQTEAERMRNRRVKISLIALPPSVVPPLPVTIPTRWRNALGGDKIRPGNQVEFLINGSQTFKEMVRAIRTATQRGHYIYLLAWWLSDDFPLIHGDNSTTIRQLFSVATAQRVQIRAMLWDQCGVQNTAEVKRINQLSTGAAILDNNTLTWGSQHQKVLIVKGNQGLISFCGGIDINPDRVYAVSPTGSVPNFYCGSGNGGKGSPLHDVHCRIQGAAAHDLLNVFIQRWYAHPEHQTIDKKKGQLLGLQEKPDLTPVGNHFVRIARTFNLIGSNDCQKDRSIRKTLLEVIKAAEKFIYIQDQYLVSMEIARALRTVLPKIQHLTILIPHSSISDLPHVWERRKCFIDELLKADPSAKKIGIFYLINPSTGKFGSYTYVHSKMWIIDDEVAVIGWSHDAEVIAAIYDGSLRKAAYIPFAQKLRMDLWSKHLQIPSNALVDGVASAKLWNEVSKMPNSKAWIRPYNQNSGKDHFSISNLFSWDHQVDPSGDKLPACPSGVEMEMMDSSTPLFSSLSFPH